MTWVETWSKKDASRELEIIREESRERRNLRKFHLLLHYFEIITLMLQVQSHLQHYSSSTLLSLSSGILLIITSPIYRTRSYKPWKAGVA